MMGVFRKFHLIRDDDITGMSGRGIVAEGVEFTDGTAVLRWLPTKSKKYNGGKRVLPTTVMFSHTESILALHGHGRATYLRFEDGSTAYQEEDHG